MSEIFPMETRALAIATFGAVGTGIVGFGPLAFGPLVPQNHRGPVFAALCIGAAVMIVGGGFEIRFGVKAASTVVSNRAR